MRRFMQCVFLAFLAAGCYDAGKGTQKKLESAPTGTAKVGIRVGDLAPEIVGEDADGEKFKLSDYRGKVVLLDFWFEN